ncbi:MAG TPA: hypothetical protein VLB44_16810 [Kofleriaceae bacterium]|nr:hypothetical protein [Kofleriaceae bacterium]
MVVRVPLVGVVVAVALLMAENLGANAYVSAKQREVERQPDQARIAVQQARAAAQRLREAIERRDRQDQIEELRREIERNRLELAPLFGPEAQARHR